MLVERLGLQRLVKVAVVEVVFLQKVFKHLAVVVVKVLRVARQREALEEMAALDNQIQLQVLLLVMLVVAVLEGVELAVLAAAVRVLFLILLLRRVQPIEAVAAAAVLQQH